MTSSLASRPAQLGRFEGAEPLRLRDVVVAEWTKLRSLRSTAWSFAAYVAASIGFSVLATSLYTAKWEHLGAADRRQMIEDPIGLILQPGALWGQIALCVLGAMIFTGEYSTGMIRSSMLAVPRRTPVLLAKAGVLAGLTFAVAEIVAFTSFFAGRAIISQHVPISLGDPGVLRAVVGTGIYLALTALFALSIGAVVRHVAGAITLVLALTLVLPAVSSVLPGRSGTYLADYIPGGQAGQMIMSSGHGSRTYILSPWQGLAVCCAWTAVALVFAAMSLSRRDV